MDKLKEMLLMDPCYEQHIVSIKNIYEEYLYSMLVPAIYEGFQSLYKKAYEIEEKFIIASKKNPDIENPGILTIFKTLIKEIPNLNNHKIRNETDRIKSSTKSADIFDDLIKAVIKSNIILLTYNIDYKRKDLLKSKYHENIIIYDFIHSCYIQSARNFFDYTELFYHNFEPVIINQNKRTCHKIIKNAICEAIRLMLPMKEILLDYLTQKYEQKDIVPNQMYYNSIGGNPNDNSMINPMNNHNHNHNIIPSLGITKDEFVEVNKLVGRDLRQYRDDNNSILEESENYDYDRDEDEYDENEDDNNNNFSIIKIHY
jgi:hypothetical protein